MRPLFILNSIEKKKSSTSAVLQCTAIGKVFFFKNANEKKPWNEKKFKRTRKKNNEQKKKKKNYLKKKTKV